MSAMFTRGTVIWLLVCATVVTGRLSASDATFNSQKANPANSIGAAASIPGMRLATGTYTGNAADPRTISGVGFAPDVVIIKGNNNQVAVIRTATMAGDATKPMVGATAIGANLIQSFTADGFTVGSGSQVNGLATTYYWTAMKAAGSALSVGSYTGNGTSQSITGRGFSPEYVNVFPATNQRAQLRIAGMSRSFQFDSNTGITTGITSLDSNGFSVGNDATVNSAGVAYHYLAWNEVPGAIDADTYTGNGVDNRSIAGTLQPQYAVVRSGDTATAREGAHRPASLTGTASLNFAATANDTNSIQALQASGFQVGTDASVNANGAGYSYVAFRDQP